MSTNDHLKEVVGSVFNKETEEIRRQFEAVDPTELAAVVEMIATCEGTILTSGAGTSGILARKVAHTFCCVGKPALFLSPVDAIHGGSGMVRKADTAILFSKGGETQELVNLLVPLEHKEVNSVIVTEKPDSTLGNRCTQLLKVGPSHEVDPNDVIATASITAVNVLFDAIAMMLLERTGYTLDDFAPTHPGGAVGKRLLGGEE